MCIARLVCTLANTGIGAGFGLLTLINIQIATIHLLVSIIGHFRSALHIKIFVDGPVIVVNGVNPPVVNVEL